MLPEKKRKEIQDKIECYGSGVYLACLMLDVENHGNAATHLLKDFIFYLRMCNKYKLYEERNKALESLMTLMVD